MKNNIIRRAAAVLMAMLLTMTLISTAYADSTAAHTITIKNSDSTETHSYTAYKVFSGDYDPGSGVLSNVGWGDGVNDLAVTEYLRANVPAFAECATAQQFVKVLADLASDSPDLRAFAAAVDLYRTNPAGSAEAAPGGEAVISVTGDGYYYVKDSTEALENETYSDYILLVEGDVTVEAKDAGGTTSQKKVKDVNDSTGEGSGWQDSADYDIGDPVPFQFTGKVSMDYALYDSYTVIFHDRQSPGLTFDHITGVFVDGNEISEGWELITHPEDRCVFEVRFPNLKTISAVAPGSIITVEYISVLNEDAAIGEAGNPNEMRMEFSNNPTDETSTGFTPLDKVIVFTYELDVVKTDENGDPLPGAEFTLEKWISDPTAEGGGFWQTVDGGAEGQISDSATGPVATINGKSVRAEEFDGRLYYKLRDKPNEESQETDIYLLASDLDAVASYIENGASLGVPYYAMTNGMIVPVEGNFGYKISSVERRSTDGTSFAWKGVDDGHYRITETVTPPGYNTMEPVEFDVVAEHEEESENPVLIGVDGNPFLPTGDKGILSCNIINMSGGLLPSTGGIGTTIFYALGGLLVLSSGVWLVVRKRSRVVE